MEKQIGVFGREKQIKQFFEIAVNNFVALRVIGVSGSGKTTFLKYLAFNPIEEFDAYSHDLVKLKILYIDLDSGIKVPSDFYKQVIARIDEELNQLCSIEERKNIDFREFESFLRKNISGLRVVILLDGFDNIMLSDNFKYSFFLELRSLMNSLQLRWVTSLLTGTFTEDAEAKTNYFFNPFNPAPMYLGELEDEEARQFVIHLTENQKAELIDEEIKEIFNLSGKLPYFLEQTTKSWLESKGQHSLEKSENISKELLIKFLSPDDQLFTKLNLISRSLFKSQTDSILRVINSTEKLTKKEITSAQDILLNFGILKDTRGIVEISCELFKAFFSVPDVLLKEIFKYNLKSNISLIQLEVNGLYFFGDFIWDFQPGVNILLGKNGYGKSHLMRLILCHLQIEGAISDKNFFIQSKSGAYVKILVNRNDEPETIHKGNKVFFKDIGKIPVLAIPDLRFLDKSRLTINMLPDEIEGNLSEIGAAHFIREKPYARLVENFFGTFCKDFFIEGSKDEHIRDVLKRFKLGSLLEEIIWSLTDEGFKFSGIESDPGINNYKIEVITHGNDENNPLPIQKTSQGTLSVLIVFGLIHNYLKTIYKNSVDVNNEPGLVFIDEIDAHLHPAWQQKIVGLLRKIFPNVQFVLSSHSPLVVAGCREKEVVVLRKIKEDKGFSIHQFENDFIGYTAPEIYERIFEIDPIDDDFKEYLSRLSEIPEIEKVIEEKQVKINVKEKLLLQLGNSLSRDKYERIDQIKNELKVLKKEIGVHYDDLHYINIAKRKYDKNQEYDRLLRENRMLKYELKMKQSKKQ